MQGDLEARIRNLEEIVAHYLRKLRDLEEKDRHNREQIFFLRSLQQPASR